MKPGPVPLRGGDPLRRRQDDIIAALRAERILRGLSQAQVGASLLSPSKNVCNWENRRWATPVARSVRDWHAVLGLAVPPDVDMVFKPDVPRCPSRGAYERHRRKREACTTCREWLTARRRGTREEKEPRSQVWVLMSDADLVALRLLARASGLSRSEVFRRLVARGRQTLKPGERL